MTRQLGVVLIVSLLLSPWAEAQSSWACKRSLYNSTVLEFQQNRLFYFQLAQLKDSDAERRVVESTFVSTDLRQVLLQFFKTPNTHEFYLLNYTVSSTKNYLVEELLVLDRLQDCKMVGRGALSIVAQD